MVRCNKSPYVSMHLLLQHNYNCGRLSWQLLSRRFIGGGSATKVDDSLEHIDKEGSRPFRDYVSVLRQYASAKALTEGKHVHEHLIRRGLDGNALLASLLVRIYGECGYSEDARVVFVKLPQRNVFSWNFMIRAYLLRGQSNHAFHFFTQMETEGVMPNKVSFLSILSTCATLEEGRRLHTLIQEWESDVVILTAVVHMYDKCSSLEDARKVFDKMREKDVRLWTTIIATYGQRGLCEEALQLSKQMHLEGVMPNEATFVSLLDACSRPGVLAEGKRIHTAVVIGGFQSHVIVGTALVNMYGKCSNTEGAKMVFDKIHARNVVSWTAMIAVFAQNGHGKEALKLFNLMQGDGVLANKVTFLTILSACPSLEALAEGKQLHTLIVGRNFDLDVAVASALVNMYSKCCSLEDACIVFDKMSERDVIAWSSLIATYAEQGLEEDALQAFDQMQCEGVLPNNVTYLSVIEIYASLGELAKGKQINVLILGGIFPPDVTLGNALVTMYGKCGSLAYALSTFGKLPQRDEVSWTALISIYAQYGCGKEALHLFEQMQLKGAIPSVVTFLSILSACSHAGLVDDWRHCFLSMIKNYGVVPTVDHYNCMVDLLGRAGLLEEAEDLIDRMPFQPSSLSLTALLGACRYHFDVQRGRRVEKNASELEQSAAEPFAVLSNIMLRLVGAKAYYIF